MSKCLQEDDEELLKSPNTGNTEGEQKGEDEGEMEALFGSDSEDGNEQTKESKETKEEQVGMTDLFGSDDEDDKPNDGAATEANLFGGKVA